MIGRGLFRSIGAFSLAFFAFGYQCAFIGLGEARTQHSKGKVKTQVKFEDLPLELRDFASGLGLDREGFSKRIAAIERETIERELQGEFDHLIYYLLQSRKFTGRAPIEPALSAYEFAGNLSEAERSKYVADGSTYQPSVDRIPESARARMTDFIRAAARKPADPRLAYFNKLISKSFEAAGTVESLLNAEYTRAMRFLYRKEFASRAIKADEITGYIAALYRERGHSTDTQIEANFAVHTALASLKAQMPDLQFDNVMIIGPGLDFAPRTDYTDLFEPQCYQPFAVADSLLSLKLSLPSRLQIHCIDINERVIAHLQSLKEKRQAKLALFSGTGGRRSDQYTDDFIRYFADLGNSIGRASVFEAASGLERPFKKSLEIRAEIVGRISAERINIITERYERSPQYDLIIVTNVFPYFKIEELLLALTNVSAMLKGGGYLIHNELQSFPREFAAPLGLPLELARTVLIASGDGNPLFDAVAVHKRVKP